jgi:serine/threonine-protein kinase RsbT
MRDRETAALKQAVVDILEDYLSSIIARTILNLAIKRCGEITQLTKENHKLLMKEIEDGVHLYTAEEASRDQCMNRIRTLLSACVTGEDVGDAASTQKVKIETENDIVYARKIGRKMSSNTGFRLSGQIKLATAISELARNIVQYAGSGELRLSILRKGGRPGIEVVAEDHGPGISNLDDILGGAYRSKTGLGKGLTGTKNLVDEFNIVSSAMRGTCVTIRMYSDHF